MPRSMGICSLLSQSQCLGARPVLLLVPRTQLVVLLNSSPNFRHCHPFNKPNLSMCPLPISHLWEKSQEEVESTGRRDSITEKWSRRSLTFSMPGRGDENPPASKGLRGFGFAPITWSHHKTGLFLLLSDFLLSLCC